LYQWIAGTLRERIVRGEYRRGGQLPTEEMLVREFDVSRITVRAALDLLVAEGMLRRERGRGTFVTDPPVEHSLVRLTDFVEDMVVAGLQPASRIVAREEVPASDEVRHWLRLPSGSTVLRLDRLRLADDLPIAFDITYLPLRYGRLLDAERLAYETIYQQLEQTYGIAIVFGAFIIEATALDADVAALLEVPEGSPSLVIRRTSFTANDEPVYVQTRSYRADRVRYRLELDRQRASRETRITQLTPLFDDQPPSAR
jgi:GntR family transcriptional regulator